MQPIDQPLRFEGHPDQTKPVDDEPLQGLALWIPQLDAVLMDWPKGSEIPKNEEN